MARAPFVPGTISTPILPPAPSPVRSPTLPGCPDGFASTQQGGSSPSTPGLLSSASQRGHTRQIAHAHLSPTDGKPTGGFSSRVPRGAAPPWASLRCCRACTSHISSLAPESSTESGTAQGEKPLWQAACCCAELSPLPPSLRPELAPAPVTQRWQQQKPREGERHATPGPRLHTAARFPWLPDYYRL